MSVLKRVIRAVTLRDLDEQIRESKDRIAKAEEQLRSAPPEKVRRVLQSSSKE